MTYRYRVTGDAERDLTSIEEYVLSYSNLDFVDALDDMFLDKFAKLCHNPYAYPVYQFESPVNTLHEYRSVNVYRYKVFYWVDGDVVEICRISLVAADFTRRPF